MNILEKSIAKKNVQSVCFQHPQRGDIKVE